MFRWVSRKDSNARCPRCRCSPERDAKCQASPAAKRLNAEAVLGPHDGSWGPTTIHGHQSRGTGILNNERYLGRLVWGRLKYSKHPEARKRISRPAPAASLDVIDVPHMRLLDDALWQILRMSVDPVMGHYGVVDSTHLVLRRRYVQMSEQDALGWSVRVFRYHPPAPTRHASEVVDVW